MATGNNKFAAWKEPVMRREQDAFEVEYNIERNRVVEDVRREEADERSREERKQREYNTEK